MPTYDQAGRLANRFSSPVKKKRKSTTRKPKRGSLKSLNLKTSMSLPKSAFKPVKRKRKPTLSSRITKLGSKMSTPSRRLGTAAGKVVKRKLRARKMKKLLKKLGSKMSKRGLERLRKARKAAPTKARKPSRKPRGRKGRKTIIYTRQGKV